MRLTAEQKAKSKYVTYTQVVEVLKDHIEECKAKYRVSVLREKEYWENTLKPQILEAEGFRDEITDQVRRMYAGEIHVVKDLAKTLAFVEEGWLKEYTHGAVNYSRSRNFSNHNHEMKRLNDESHLNKVVEDYGVAIVVRICKALANHEATEFVPVFVKNGSLGIEGIFHIGEGRKVGFEAIVAGGYNIQCLHYRYLVKKLKGENY